MTFQDFLIKKYPLYVNPEMKVNLTVSQLCELVEEWEKSNVKTYEMFEDGVREVIPENIFCHHNGTYTQVENSNGVLVCCKCRKPVKSL